MLVRSVFNYEAGYFIANEIIQRIQIFHKLHCSKLKYNSVLLEQISVQCKRRGKGEPRKINRDLESVRRRNRTSKINYLRAQKHVMEYTRAGLEDLG